MEVGGKASLLNEEDKYTGDNGQLSFWTKILYGIPAGGWFGSKYMKLLYMPRFYSDDYPRASLSGIAICMVRTLVLYSASVKVIVRIYHIHFKTS